MTTEETAIRLAEKLLNLTRSGKLNWIDAGKAGPWGSLPGQVLKASVEAGVFAQVAEVPLPKSLIRSYYFGVLEGKPEMLEISVEDSSDTVFAAFAEGYPAEPTEEKLHLLRALKELFSEALGSAKGTWRKVERFEQLLERMA